MYNLTLINSTGLVTLTQTVNSELMFGMWGNMMLLTIFVICFMSFNRFANDTKRPLAYSFTIIAILSLLLTGLNLVNDYVVLFSWTMAGLFTMLVFMTSD